MMRALCYWSGLGYLYCRGSGPFACLLLLVQTSVVSFLLTVSDSTVAMRPASVWLLVWTSVMSFLLTVSGSAVAVSLVWTGLVLFLVRLDLPGIGTQGLERAALFLRPIGHVWVSSPSIGLGIVSCSGIASVS
jgi:hypothetical protein